MKSLSKHILEKLVINKNFENVKYNHVGPTIGEGICLNIIFYPNNDEYISLNLTPYECKGRMSGGAWISDYPSSDMSYYIRYDNGYFYNKKWINRTHVALFNDDALTFLEELLQNPTQKMSTSEFSNEIKITKNNTMFLCKSDDNTFYSENQIKDMISKIS